MVSIKNLPVKTKRLLGLGIILALVVALPLFIWAIITQRFDVRERAQVATAEPQTQVDLIVQDITIEKIAPSDVPCESYRYTVTIKNIGTESAKVTRLNNVVSPTQFQRINNCTSFQSYSGSNAPIPINVNEEVEAGEWQTYSDYFNPNYSGDVTINSQIDYYNEINELNESNNSLTKTFYVDRVFESNSTPPPTDGRKPLLFKVKFEGVSDGAADGAKATIRFVSGNYINVITDPISFWHVGSGVYEALIWPFDGFYLPMWGDGNGYSIFVKGEKHYANKFCTMIGQIGPCKGVGNIPIPEVTAPPYSLFDFTGYPLQPGDLPIQDGNADMQDFARISDLTFKLCGDLTPDERARADLDYNGCVNTKDLFLMRKTLETKSDEY